MGNVNYLIRFEDQTHEYLKDLSESLGCTLTELVNRMVVEAVLRGETIQTKDGPKYQVSSYLLSSSARR